MLGKTLPYEEDVVVPPIIRSPKVPANKRNKEDVYSMVDLGAGADVQDYSVDGRDFLKQHSGNGKEQNQDMAWLNIGMVQVEEGVYSRSSSIGNKTYRSIRVKDDTGGDDDWVYGVWCTGERELYDLRSDSYQLHSLACQRRSQIIHVLIPIYYPQSHPV
ncbi:hypothetical protein E1B28_003214 [Marasmius oreades]|uniref:Uncharacterized protein n=1 Tax=Marasmius oreades TaxID=181124 RepID=A0A9P7UN72_9AGAR|nr:uncharacterized protein E1B28_003214 [Marasmius oreades]KAG7085669.1 hypothetical protein E1B28_003214 [Marasmius oreades]